MLALGLPGGAHADEPAPTPARLAAIAQELGSSQAQAREAAIEALSTLPIDALPAIEARIAELVRAPVRGEDAYEVLRSFAHAVGSRDASEPVDIAPGIGPVLETGRSRVRVRVAERLLLLRSLEHMGTARALVVALDLLKPEFETFRWEARHIATRSGARSAAMLLRASGMVGTGLTAVGKSGLESLGLDRPATALAGQTDESIVEIIRAYGAILHMSGMPAVADLVDDDRPGVQAAAREAMERYGQNGIWQLRRVMAQRLGVEAKLDLSWQATMHALYEGLDAKRLAPDYAALDAALEMHSAGKTEEAVVALDTLLARAPELPRRREAGLVYAAHGRAALEGGRFEVAYAALERALHLDGSHPDGTEWRAERTLAEAELALASGAPSAELFAAALASPRTHDRAAARLEAKAPAVPMVDAQPFPPPSPAVLAILGGVLLILPLLRRALRKTPATAARLGASARKLAHTGGVGAGAVRSFVMRFLWALPGSKTPAHAATARQGAAAPSAAPAASGAFVAAFSDSLDGAATLPGDGRAFAEGPVTIVDDAPFDRSAGAVVEPTPPATPDPRPALPAELVFGASTRPAPTRRQPSRPRPVMPAELLFGTPSPAPEHGSAARSRKERR